MKVSNRIVGIVFTELYLRKCFIIFPVACIFQLMDFVVDNFGTADVYHRVFVEGDYRTGQFIFKKS